MCRARPKTSPTNSPQYSDALSGFSADVPADWTAEVTDAETRARPLSFDVKLTAPGERRDSMVLLVRAVEPTMSLERGGKSGVTFVRAYRSWSPVGAAAAEKVLSEQETTVGGEQAMLAEWTGRHDELPGRVRSLYAALLTGDMRVVQFVYCPLRSSVHGRGRG